MTRYTVSCDSCDNEVELSTAGNDGLFTQEDLIAQGWVFDGAEDFCPGCADGEFGDI